MGGDHAPGQILQGAAAAADEYGVQLVIVGDSAAIGSFAAEQEMDLSRFEIVHADSCVSMDDDPLCVIHAKKNSSMCVGLRMLAEGRGDAFVCAGNTGALFTAATLIVRKLPGIQRAAIASVLPMTPPVLLMDAGANISVTDEYLEQFAIMGNVYMRRVFGTEKPRVGLLNNGSEPGKGTQLHIDAYNKLSANPDINFVGNIEANKVPADVCDVLVTDGFTGNILLKSIEGMGKLMGKMLKETFSASILTKMSSLVMKNNLKAIKGKFDASNYGGAPLLGLRKPVIKAHGSSDAKAFKNAIGQAISYSKTGVTEEISCKISCESAAQEQPQQNGTSIAAE